MSDYLNRYEWEARLARELTRLSKRQLSELFGIMGDPPRLENVPAQYWDGMYTQWSQLMTPKMEAIFVDSAKEMLSDPRFASIGVSWDLVNEDASRWARGQYLLGDIDTSIYPQELADLFTNRRMTALSDLIPRFYQEGWTIRDLEQKLDSTFGAGWGEMVATTEVTRASARGELAVVDELRKEGIEMVTVWQTSNDELVCPVCGPRNGKRKGDGWTEPPPAHPRCRCWMNHEFVKPNGNDNN